MLLLRKLKILKGIIITLVVWAPIVMTTVHAGTEYKVKSSDNLSRVVDKFYKDSKLNRDQVFIALLAENPNAFKYGNINYLRSQRILKLPQQSDLLLMKEADARNLVAEHNGYAKQGNKIKIPAPFTDYSPKDSSLKTNNVNELAQKQQSATLKLKNLSSETEELRIRLEKLEADKEAMDAELTQLDSLLKNE